MPDDFGLQWAIKRSFVDYVRRMPDGQGVLGTGAQPRGTDEVLFVPESTGQRTAPDGSVERMWTFAGHVHFSGHFGMLSVRLANPRVVLADGIADLDIADPYSNDPEKRLDLVTLTLEQLPAGEGTERWAGTGAKLTPAGSELFNEVYPPGEPFEDLLMTLPLIAQK